MRRLLLPVLFLAIAVLIYFGASLWKADPVQRVPSAATANNEKSSPPLVSAPADTPKPPTATIPAGENSTPSPGDLRALAQTADAFLASQGSTAYNFLAAFTATGNRAFLEQALTRFPSDPAVLMVALADEPRGARRAAMIEAFKAADPNNPLPYIFSAADAFEDGRVEDAVADLKEALKRPGFYTYFNERAAALHALALQSGASDFAARNISLFNQTLPHLQAAMKVSRGVQAHVDAQISQGDTGSVDANVMMLYELGRMFQTPEASRLLIGQLVGVALEGKALEVAASLQANPLPVQPEARRGELSRIRDETKDLTTVAHRVIAEPNLWQAYFARFRADGEMAALRWVKQQPAGAAVSPPANVPSPVSALGD